MEILKSLFSFTIFVVFAFVVNISTGVTGIKHVFNCTTQFGTYADEISCERYWICQYGTAMAATCNFGLIVSYVIPHKPVFFLL